MQIENSTIKTWGADIENAFQKISNDGYKSIYQFDIHSNFLDDRYITQDIRFSEKFGDIFSNLQKIENSPCVYVFEVLSDTPTKDIIEKFQSLLGKVKPSLKKKPPIDSRILYVGKVKRGIWGRIIEHLGYHTKKNGELSKSHGLQLYHWAREMNLGIRVQIYEFDEKLADYMEIVEKKFAIVLKPIVGRH